MKIFRSRLFIRTISIIILAVILITALSACGNKEDKTDKKQDASTAAAEPTKLTVAVATNPNVQDIATNYYTKLIEKEQNVKLDFYMLPTKMDEIKTKFTIMVSSGSTLPDVVNVNFDEVTAYDYASKGVFIKLDDYYKNSAPNFMKIKQEDRDIIYGNLKLTDGSVYSLPGYEKVLWNEASYRFWISSVWLQKLNLKEPATTDELYDVLKAFVEKDPNGNGKKDEIGIIGSVDGWSTNPVPFLMNAFINADPGKSYFDVKDGKVRAAFTQPEWKQGLEYIAKLVKDGLLSPLAFTQDNTQMKSLINVKGGIVGAVGAGSYSTFDKAVLGEDNMVLLGPVKGPNGFCSVAQNISLPVNYWFITKDCKNPDIAFKVGDYMLDNQISKISRFGEKGVEWTDDPATLDLYYNANPNTKLTIAVLNDKFWNNPQNKSWMGITPFYLDSSKEANSSTKKENGKPIAYEVKYKATYVPVFPKEVISKLSYSPDELKKIANIKAAIDKYVKDSIVQFVTGYKPLSQWNSYLAELDKMGLKDYIAANQAAYDRTKK